MPGTRVKRGPNWCWGEQDGGPGRLGQVIAGAQAGWVYVRWDSDQSNTRGYRWGAEGAYDVMVALVPAAASPASELALYTQVMRGPSWIYGDQDGGPGRLGVVETVDPGHVYVVWDYDLDRNRNRYRWGAEGAFDVMTAPLSITREGMKAVLGKVQTLLQDVGYAIDADISSGTLQDLFKGESELTIPGSVGKHARKDRTSGAKKRHEAFHPLYKYREHYSPLPPKIVVTYTWRMTLKQLKQFMDRAESDLGLTGDPATTWWIDILFNDQRESEIAGAAGPALKRALERAKGVYRRADYHVVLMMHQVFSRGWCNAELVYRMQVRTPHMRAAA